MNKTQFSEKISELHQLYKDGYINDLEFNRLKEDLLSALFENLKATEKVSDQTQNRLLIDAKYVGKAGQKLSSAALNFLLYLIFSVFATILIYRAFVSEVIPAILQGRVPQIEGTGVISIIFFIIAGVGIIMFIVTLLKAGEFLRKSLLIYNFNHRLHFNFTPNEAVKEKLTGSELHGGIVAITRKFSKKVMIINHGAPERFATYEEAIALQKSHCNIAGYSDWFLPNTKEMTAVYMNLFKNGLGRLQEEKYWTSRYSDQMSKKNYYYNNSEEKNKYLVFNFKTGKTEEVAPDEKYLVRMMRIDSVE
ncbi:hypothetical protein QA597_10580 [Marinilabiliaceae bacterium ANBcel2]|nr:hypothetical protein [Marinilabiliaceae bacterium ANBcel2]